MTTFLVSMPERSAEWHKRRICSKVTSNPTPFVVATSFAYLSSCSFHAFSFSSTLVSSQHRRSSSSVAFLVGSFRAIWRSTALTSSSLRLLLSFSISASSEVSLDIFYLAAAISLSFLFSTRPKRFSFSHKAIVDTSALCRKAQMSSWTDDMSWFSKHWRSPSKMLWAKE